MRSTSLFFGLAMLLAFSGCASDDAPVDGPPTDGQADTAPISDNGNAVDDALTCESSRPAEIASPGACAVYSLGVTRFEVDYGSPSVKGREIFGGLVPYGEVWRTGANEATTFSTSGNLLVNGDTLAAGTYGLFTVPNETQWEVIFNSVSEQWGAFEYDRSTDVVRVTATPTATDASLERFTISFEGTADTSAVMTLAWDDVRVPVSLSAGD